MHRPSIHPGDLIFRRLGNALPMVLLVSLLASGPTSADTFESFAATDSTFPVIAHITANEDSPGEVILAGHGFAPGEPVFIAIHDMWGQVQHETRWITASEVSYQPPPDLPPGEGFSFDTGGNFAETFQIAVGAAEVPSGSQNPALGPVTSMPTTMPGMECATSLMAMAYDRSTATWSNIVTIDLGCAG